MTFRWFGLAKVKPDPGEEARRREEQDQDAVLITNARAGVTGPAGFTAGAIAQLIVNLKRALVAQQQCTHELTERIRILTLWLLIFGSSPI